MAVSEKLGSTLPFLTLQRWRQLCRQVGIEHSTVIDQEFNRLMAAYGEAQRGYHTAQHIHDCLMLLDWSRDQGVDAVLQEPTLELALWYHDVIYDPRRSDNERLSANQAVTFLQRHGVASAQMDEVESLIMATCHVGNPVSKATAAPWMVDIDLAILGSQPQRFVQYGQQIRYEYSWVAEVDYWPQRRAILRLFLDQLPIYQTALFRGRFEVQAQINLAAAIA